MNAFDLEATLSLDTSQYEQALMSARKVGQGFSQETSGIPAATHKMANGFTVLKGVAANLVSGGINMLAGAITSNLGGAISRVDTLNNYTKVMTNLGKAPKDAEKAINELAEGINGLPTTLNAIASTQQQFAALGGSLEDATKLTLALNNATLAGGQGQAVANSAMNQWYQMIAAGKPDLMSMRIINQAMPAQLDAIAKSVLGSKANWQDLNKEWQKSPELTEKVKSAILELNDADKGFAEQAQDATKGIATSMQNMQTAISRGIANIIDEIGAANIAGKINGITEGINSVFGGIKNFIAESKDIGIGEALANAIEGARDKVWNAYVKLMNIDWPLVFSNAFTLLGDAFATTFQAALQFDTLKADILVRMMSVAGEMITGFIDAIMTHGEDIATSAIDIITNFVDGMKRNAIRVVDGAIKLINTIVEYIGNNSDTIAKQAVKIVLALSRGLAKNAPKIISAAIRLGAAVITGVIKVLPKLPAVAFKMVTALVKALWAKRGEFLDVGKQIVEGIGKGITAGTEWIKGRIRAFVGNVKDFLKRLFGINSPSKWAADVIGRGIDEGMAKGIEDNTGIIDSAMKDLLPDVKLPNISGSNGALRVLNINAPITVNGAENPTAWATSFVDALEMKARAV